MVNIVNCLPDLYSRSFFLVFSLHNAPAGIGGLLYGKNMQTEALTDRNIIPGASIYATSR